jgi:NAD(P)-dependent dehydrogenase (short-subunit alcohol dehydrogenase family)
MTKQSMAILGGGELSTAIVNQLNQKFDINVFGHDKFDIRNKEQCNDIIVGLESYDIVVITAGKHSEDIWDMWMVNNVGPAYIISNLENKYSNKKIIAVTSHGSSWTSWPGIDINRLVYNSSKSGLTNFVYGLIHRDSSKNRITILEPSRFQSTMSNNTGADINLVVNQIESIIDDPMHILKIVCK